MIFLYCLFSPITVLISYLPGPAYASVFLVFPFPFLYSFLLELLAWAGVFLGFLSLFLVVCWTLFSSPFFSFRQWHVPKQQPTPLPSTLTIGTYTNGNQVEDAQAHEAQAQQGAQGLQGVQAQQGAQAQRITRSMARDLGQEYNKMALLISFVELGCGCNKKV